MQNMERDLAQLGDLVEDDEFANELYRSSCNTSWVHEDGSTWSCSWRYAGGMVADLRNERRGPHSTHYEDYLEFYCLGGEGTVSDRIAKTLGKLGWKAVAS